MADVPQDVRRSYVSLPEGEYRLEREGQRVRVDPVYPRQRALDTAKTTAIVSAIAAGILSLDYVLRGEGPIFEQPLLMTSYIGTVSAATVATGLTLRRNRYLSQERGRTQPVTDLSAAARQELELAEAQLTVGNLDEALDRYLAILEEYPESQHVPEALFRIGRIYTLTDDIRTAIVTYKTAIETHPHPATYDRACKSLADLLFAQERYDESLVYLDRMLFLDPLYSPEEIDEYRRIILSRRDNGAPPS